MINLEPPTVGFRGKYRCVVRKAANGRVVRDTGEFENLILNAGLDWLGNRTYSGIPGASSGADYTFVGTGTAAPAVTDTAMAGTWVGTNSTQSASSNNSGSPDYYATWTGTRRFNAGVATGTWTEVGIGTRYVPSGQPAINRLFSRALIVDGSGNPISITVLADEYLDVTYILELHQEPGDFSGSFLISGTAYNYTGRRGYAGQLAIGSSWFASALTLNPTPNPGYPHSVTFTSTTSPSTSALGDISETLTKSSSVSPAGLVVTETAYTPGTYTLQASDTYGLAVGNAANGLIGFLRGLCGTAGSPNYMRSGWQILLDKPIPKTSSKILVLNWTASWGRL